MSPKSVKLSGPDHTLVVEWTDAHRSAFPYPYLRGRCPCATCTGAHPGAAPPAGPLPLLERKPVRPDRAELVGRYALQIFWNDGHSSGIYTFDYLRGLCPCAECAARRETVPE